jgi:hypothetical protein
MRISVVDPYPVGSGTFCLSGTGFGMHSGSEVKWNDKSSHRHNIKFEVKKLDDKLQGNNAAYNIIKARLCTFF